MIALLLPPAGDVVDRDAQEVTGLLERMSRPAVVRILHCTIEFGPVWHLTFDAGWVGLIDYCHFECPMPGGSNVVVESYPGVELIYSHTTVTVLELVAEAERQKRALMGGAA